MIEMCTIVTFKRIISLVLSVGFTVYLTGSTTEMVDPDIIKVKVDQKEGSLACMNSLVLSQGFSHIGEGFSSFNVRPLY